MQKIFEPLVQLLSRTVQDTRPLPLIVTHIGGFQNDCSFSSNSNSSGENEANETSEAHQATLHLPRN